MFWILLPPSPQCEDNKRQALSLLFEDVVPRAIADAQTERCTVVWYGDTPDLVRPDIIRTFRRACSVHIVSAVRAYPQMLMKMIDTGVHLDERMHTPNSTAIFVIADIDNSNTPNMLSAYSTRAKKSNVVFLIYSTKAHPAIAEKSVAEHLPQWFKDDEWAMAQSRRIVNTIKTNVDEKAAGDKKDTNDINNHPHLCCAVCREALVGAIMLIPCGHSICILCDQKAYSTCPICKLEIQDSIANYSTRQTVEATIGAEVYARIESSIEQFRALKREWKTTRLVDLGQAITDILDRLLVCSIEEMFSSTNKLLDMWGKTPMTHGEYHGLCYRLLYTDRSGRGMENFGKVALQKISDRSLWILRPSNSEMLSHLLPQIDQNFQLDNLHLFLLARSTGDAAHRALLYDHCEQTQARPFDSRDDISWMSPLLSTQKHTESDESHDPQSQTSKKRRL